MKITITRDAGMMIVDGDARVIDTTTLPAGVEVVLWDTQAESGMLQFDELQTETIQERDLVREAEINAELAANNKPPLEEAIYKTVVIQKRPRVLSDFTPYLPLYDAWVNNAPPPPPPPPPPDPRLEEIDQDLTSGLIGGLTRDQLKALSRNEYITWFNATFQTNAQLIGLLRRITLLLIRRVL